MLNTKLILVEGIPGSGKTTTAAKIKEYLDSKNIKAHLYQEGDSNPSDYAWVAILSEAVYEDLTKNYPEYKQVLENYSERDENRVLVYYLKMKNSSGVQIPQELINLLSRYEPYDGKLSAEDFFKIHMARYKKFALEAAESDEISIFESSYLQNQVNEYLGFHNLDKATVVDYLLKLAECYENLMPILIYLTQPDISATIKKAADERRSPDKSKHPDWIDLIINYVSKSPLGADNHLSGFEGAVEYFRRRKQIELEAVNKLNIRKVIVENDHYNTEKGLSDVIKAFEKIYKEEVLNDGKRIV